MARIKNIEIRNKIVICNTVFVRIFNCAMLGRYDDGVSILKRLLEAFTVWAREAKREQEANMKGRKYKMTQKQHGRNRKLWLVGSGKRYSVGYPCGRKKLVGQRRKVRTRITKQKNEHII